MEKTLQTLLAACEKAHGVKLPPMNSKHTREQIRVYHSAMAVATLDLNRSGVKVCREYGYQRSAFSYVKELIRDKPEILKLDECRAEFARMNGTNQQENPQ